jgi:hypothetical protein
MKAQYLDTYIMQKTVNRGKFITANAYIIKEERARERRAKRMQN